MYTTVSEMQTLEGVPTSIPSALVQDRIDVWTAFVNRTTRNIFEETAEMEVVFEGTGTDTLWLNIPIVTFTSLKINDQTTTLDPSLFTVFNGQDYFNFQKHNPKIVLKSSQLAESIWTTTTGLTVFRRDTTQVVKATFGTLEDGQTPTAIKYVVRKLVVRDVQTMYSNGGSSISPSQIVEEKVDRHRRKFINPLNESTWTGDRQLDLILMQYHAPRVIDMAF